ncbi:nuclear transport factor 2 family protein [uncultured Croceitalea sp.]|uniref:nuclear transport factor 2 family protein n=1 Tax=uncultured Croceitalea sp. TaxID=1798908 RepID=UPI0033065A47
MKIVFKNISLLLCTILFSFCISAQEITPEIKGQILNQIDSLKIAHLHSDSSLANRLYHPDLMLTSQSGKKYNKKVALINIKNTFESYQNSDIVLLKVADDVIISNYINERKYKDFPKGKFRLTTVWKIHEGSWKIISMQSSKIKEKKKK